MTISALLDAHGLADDGFGDEELGAAPLDFAAGSHAPDRFVRPVVEVALGGSEGPPGGRVERRRRALIERLVGTLVVELPPEGVEAHLLVGGGRRRRFAGLGLERSMHPLVTAVLLGMARTDALEPNAHL